MSATPTPLPDTWYKVHGEYLDSVLHRCVLMVGVTTGDARCDPAVAEHTRLSESLAAELVDLGRPAPFEQLSSVARFSATEREVVSLAVAFELDPALARQIGERFGQPSLTPVVVAALLDLTAAEVAQIDRPTGMLHRAALLRGRSQNSTAVEQPLRLADRTLDFLRGDDAIEARLRGLLLPIEAVPISPDAERVAHEIVGYLVDEGREPGPAQIDLIGPQGSGRAALAAHVARDLGLGLFELDVERLATRGDRVELVRAVTRELVLTPAALYLDDPSSPSDDPAQRGATAETIDAISGLVFVGTSRLRSTRRAMAIEMPLLIHGDRIKLWNAALGSSADGLDVATVSDQFRFGPRAIARAAVDARTRADLERTPLDDPTLRSICRAEVGAGLTALAHRVDARVGWNRLVIGDNERSLLTALCDHVRHRARVYGEWGIGESSARGLGTSALFSGPSGTGKTLAAEAVATELDLDLYRIDLASVVSKYIGETEKNLRSVFDAAERGGAILFFDEADALFGKRTEVKDSHDRYANIEVNYLLQRMEDHSGLSILATNRKTDLDQAFLRRIRFVVPFAFPRAPARRAIWMAELAVGMPLEPIDFDQLARFELAGGNIRNVVVNASFAAAAQDSAVATRHLVTAAAHEFAKLDKLPSRAEFGPWYDEVTS